MSATSKKVKIMDYKKLTITAIIIAILLRLLLSSMHTISGDACWHYSAAIFISENGKFPLHEQIGRDEPFWPPPLFHVIASFFYGSFGYSGLKAVPFIFGSLALIFAYLVFREILDEKKTFYAMLFMSFIPINIDYSVLGYVDSILTFFSILSIYFALKNRFVLSSLSVGLAGLAKHTGFFIIPVLLYIAYIKGDKKKFIKNFLYLSAIPVLMSLPWFFRNWILLGNPVWPYIDFLFHGFEGSPRGTYGSISLVNLSNPVTYIKIYLGFFGVPDGAPWHLFFFDIPYIWALILIFAVGTFIFILPVFFGWAKGKDHRIFHILLLSFAVVFMLFELNVRPAVSRIMLPAVIGAAFLYAHGIDKLKSRIGKMGKLFLPLTILIIIGFSFAEIVKFSTGSRSWALYSEDYEWVKQSTPKDSVFLLGSQCLPLRIERKAVFPSTDISKNTYDYVWVNQNFQLEPQSIMTADHMIILKNKDLKEEYHNDKTGTAIYKVMK